MLTMRACLLSHFQFICSLCNIKASFKQSYSLYTKYRIRVTSRWLKVAPAAVDRLGVPIQTAVLRVEWSGSCEGGLSKIDVEPWKCNALVQRIHLHTTELRE